MAICEQDRKVLIVSGGYADCLAKAKLLTKNLECLHLEDNKKANDWLGQEFDAVIFETHHDFSPNAFGAVVGTIRCGGYLLILKPDHWPHESLFLKRFNAVLERYPKIQIISSETLSPLPIPLHIDACATSDQKQAVEAIIRVVQGHRRRPLVITADRGRGKSAAMGIAAAKLSQQNTVNIGVCAPSKKAAEVIFKHAKERLPDIQLVFYSPDKLREKMPSLDLLLIDEAAAIPISLLTFFLEKYSRLVFATTQHGYEGSGRGFAINFRKVLDKLSPGWCQCQLQTPIRWGVNDSLEKFVFEALLLNAEQAPSELFKGYSLAQCSFSKCDKNNLVRIPATQLEEIFGLLVIAHYQTKPSDLMQMLDSEEISLYTIGFNHHILAVALLVEEGGIDKQTATQIFQGKRRLTGHLAAQSLAANVGLAHAPCLKGQRIIRIAVHPSLQGQGIGTYLLNKISEVVTTDYFSTSYGVTKPLLHFWKKCGFTPAYLSMKRDASSGTHSLLMLKGKNQKGARLQQEASMLFQQHFPYLLSDPFNRLEPNISVLLLRHKKKSNQPQLSNLEEAVVAAFANQQRGYENSLYPIWKLVLRAFGSANDLSDQEQEVILYKVFQKQPWQAVVKHLGDNIKGKKAALELLRSAIHKLSRS